MIEYRPLPLASQILLITFMTMCRDARNGVCFVFILLMMFSEYLQLKHVWEKELGPLTIYVKAHFILNLIS